MFCCCLLEKLCAASCWTCLSLVIVHQRPKQFPLWEWMNLSIHHLHSDQISTQLNTTGIFWGDVLDRNLHHHNWNTKWNERCSSPQSSESKDFHHLSPHSLHTQCVSLWRTVSFCFFVFKRRTMSSMSEMISRTEAIKKSVAVMSLTHLLRIFFKMQTLTPKQKLCPNFILDNVVIHTQCLHKMSLFKIVPFLIV